MALIGNANFPQNMPEWVTDESLITCHIQEVPAFLRSGTYFNTHMNEGILVTAPACCMKFDMDMSDEEEFKKMFCTLWYWGVKKVPQEVMSVVLSREHNDEVVEIFKNELQSPALNLLFQLKECPRRKWLAVAMASGELSVVEYLHLHEACPWTAKCASNAIKHGHLTCLQYAVDNGCPLSANACELAARRGRVSIYLYLRGLGIPQGIHICTEAVRGSIAQDLPDFTLYQDILHCVLKQDPIRSVSAFVEAVKHGHMRSVRLLVQQNYPYNSTVYMAAVESGQLECLKFLHVNGYTCDRTTLYRRCEKFVTFADCMRECIAHHNWLRVPWRESAYKRNFDGIAAMALINLLVQMGVWKGA